MIRQTPSLRLARARVRFLPVALLIALLWIGYITITYLVYAHGDPGLYDFSAYYLGASNLLHGGSLYVGPNGWHVYLYPPLLAQLFLPLVASTRFEIVADIWFLLSILALVAATLMLRRFVPARRWWFVALLPLLFIPDFMGLFVGQVTPIMLALLTGALIAREQNRPGLAGALLALSVWLKVYPVFMVVYFIWKRDWRVVRSVIVTGALLGALQILISGPGLMIDFLSTITSLSANGQPVGNFQNSSFLGFASRMFGYAPPVIPIVYNLSLYSLTRLLVTALVVGVTIFALVYSSRSREQDRRFDLEYALVMIVSLLLGATLWVSGEPPLLLAYILVIRKPASFRVRWLWFLSFFLVTAYHPLLLGYDGSTMPNVLYSVGFIGIMLLWGLLVGLLLQRRDPALSTSASISGVGEQVALESGAGAMPAPHGETT